MFINFAKTMFEILVANEFSYIKRANNTLVYDTEALSLYNDKGSILYIVIIANGEKISKDEYDNLVNSYLCLLNRDSKAQLVLMSIVVNDRERLLWREEDYVPGKISYYFTYNVDLDKKEIDSPENQPELLGMKAKIDEAIREMDEAYVNGTHLTGLEAELSEKYALPAKSGNINLTLSLITINIILWAFMELSGGSGNIWTLISFGAISRHLIFNLNEYYRFFTAIFLHIGVVHLANNCLGLYVFGSRVEQYFGKLPFLIIYFASGIVGNVVTVFFIQNLSAGASGAIFGLLGALMSVSYRTGRTISDLSPYAILLLCVSSIGLGFIIPGVNNFAHVAGFATGALLGRITFRRM